MLDPTPANRALVNRGIAEAMGYAVHKDYGSDGQVFIERKSTNGSVWWQTIDYTRDLNACYEVCEERGIKLSVVPFRTNGQEFGFCVEAWVKKDGIWLSPKFDKRGTDRPWLEALAVWEAVKATRTCGAPDCDDTAHPCG